MTRGEGVFIPDIQVFDGERGSMPLEAGNRQEGHALHPLPNLRHLRAFLLVADTGSVNRAAEHANISQPALTQAIASLEQIFGVELFNRHQTGMYLTADGTRLRARLTEAFAALSSGLGEAASAAIAPAAKADPAYFLTASQLNALTALHQLGDCQAAATQLGILVTSLHRSIRSLEDRLCAKLMLRAGQGVQFSRGGTFLAQQAKLAIRELELAFEDIDWARGINRGRLTIGALPLTRSYIAPKALVTVATRHPELRVRLVEGSYPVLLRALCEGDIDVLVGALRQPAPVAGVHEEPLFSETLRVVARADHPLVRDGGIKLDQLFRFPWVAPRIGSPARRQFELLMQEAAVRPPVLLEVASHDSVRAILFESDALALLSPEQIRYEVQNGQLAVLPVDWAIQPRAIGYTVRSNWRPTPAQEELIEVLKETCAHL